MDHNRRKTLCILGGGLIVGAVAAGINGTVIASQTPKTALLPWQKAGHYKDIRYLSLSYALLAPNPHNKQPWLVELLGDDQIVLWRDETRLLYETDPYGRQINIGLGCFLEQMRLAAAQHGYFVDMKLFPEGLSGPVAHAEFIKGASRDPLFDYILQRRSTKQPYEDRPIDNTLIEKMSGLADFVTGTAQVAAVKDIAWASHMVEMLTPRTLKESVDVMRFGSKEIDANPDGIALGGGLLEVLSATGMLTKESNLDVNGFSFKEGVKMYEAIHMATPAYAYLTTKSNSAKDQVETGYRWVRLNLTTTMYGLSLHPVSQSLQEYPEMAEQYSKIHELLAKPGETVQMLGRLGYGPKTSQSPRWPLEAKLKSG